MSDSRITPQEYYAEIAALAKQAWESTDKDDSLNRRREAAFQHIDESVDGHQWVIYDCYHFQVLEICSSYESAADDFGPEALSDKLKSDGLSGLHSFLVFCGMRQDAYNDLEPLVEAEPACDACGEPLGEGAFITEEGAACADCGEKNADPAVIDVAGDEP